MKKLLIMALIMPVFFIFGCQTETTVEVHDVIVKNDTTNNTALEINFTSSSSKPSSYKSALANGEIHRFSDAEVGGYYIHVKKSDGSDQAFKVAVHWDVTFLIKELLGSTGSTFIYTCEAQ